MGKEPLENLKGRAKEAAGAVTGSEALKREGEAQQDKAEAQERAARERRRAEEAEAEQRRYE